MQDNYVVIMAGGVGTRFWPFSRQSFPKQFHDVLGTGRTLLQQTADRFEGVCPKENIYIVTGEPYKEITAEQLPYLNEDQILCEPGRRNTAPCIAYACFKIASKNPNARIVVAPADHVIIKEEEFKRRILIALEFAGQNDALLTLGIKPTHPNTGYGYIHFEENEGKVHEVKTFTEKPNFDLATKFVASGDYVWNAGIFIWSAKAVSKAFSKHLPEMYEAFLKAKPHFYTEKEAEALAEAYPQCRKISIDNGLMEKADNVHVVLSDIGWSDLGTWKSVYELSNKDEDNNAIDGNVMLRNSKGCIVKTPKDKLVVVNGVSGLIISEFQNVLMICKLEDEQEVKQLVAQAEGRGKEYV